MTIVQEAFKLLADQDCENCRANGKFSYMGSNHHCHSYNRIHDFQDKMVKVKNQVYPTRLPLDERGWCEYFEKEGKIEN